MVRSFALVTLIAVVIIGVFAGCAGNDSNKAFEPFSFAVFPDGKTVTVEGLAFKNPVNGLWEVWDDRSGKVYVLMCQTNTSSNKTDAYMVRMTVRVAPETEKSNVFTAELLEVQKVTIYGVKDWSPKK